MLAAPVIACLMRSVNRRFRRYSARIQNSMGDVTRVAKEAIDAHRVVKVFNAQDHMRAASGGQRAQPPCQHEADRGARRQQPGGAVHRLVRSRRRAVRADRQLAAGTCRSTSFFGFLTALMLVTAPLRRLVNVSGPLQQGIAAGASVFEVLDAPTEPQGGTRTLTRARGEVEFRDVSFAYDTDKGEVLHDVNLHVPAGTTVAIVGRSGSGKSTLVALVPRFYDPSSGAVLVDGVDMREYPLRDLRAQVSLVSQEVVLFNDTIRNNIVFGATGHQRCGSSPRRRDAAYVIEFVAELPQGSTPRSAIAALLLSGGQRQRIAIARALLRDSPILILDEATSALDTESERHIQAALDRLVRDRTTLVIAHRLSTIEHADQIMVMQEGAIVESARTSSWWPAQVYAQLHQLQFNV